MERVLDRARTASGEHVALCGGDAPSPERVHLLVDALSDGAAVAIADDGSNPDLSRTWQQLARDGLRTVVVPPEVGESIAVVVRDRIPPPESPMRRAFERPSWWAAVTVVAVFAIGQLVRIAGEAIRIRPSEARWLSAARFGSVNDLLGVPIDGSSLWPALMRIPLEVTGVTGLRVVSLMFTVVAIACAANASSRLFGRWAARLTAAALAVGFTMTGVAVATTPVPLALAALAVALLGVALVDSTDRRSWVLMSGLATTVAVVALYQTVAFAIPLTLALLLMRGRSGWVESRAFRLVLAGGILAWFLPTRTISVAFILTGRRGESTSDMLGDLALVAVAVVVLGAVLLWGIDERSVRRRVLVLASGMFAIPFANLVSDAPDSDDASIAIAMLFAAPAIGGALAHRFALLTHGRETVPVVRDAPELLRVDPELGRLDGIRVRYPNRQVRLAAVLVVLGSIWYLPWAAMNVDGRNWWIAIPFLAANAVVVATTLLSAFNNRTRSIPLPVEMAPGHEPLVGVIVPTYSEPLHMVLATVRSILDQDWPTDRLRIVVSDDAHDDAVADAILRLAADLPDGVLHAHRPPRKDDPARRGESKAGNLNSAIALLDEMGCEYVETRDADDLVGSPDFLRATVAHLVLDPGLGFVQTIKETTTSVGDPFNNNEPFFYRGMMLARNTDHGTFPCGSGLVWRRRALRDIDDFPAWNLVEDLHSGVLAIRAGWRGLYVPIVGAHAQHSPEDIPNVFKQRGTWALDTIRLAAFDRFRGLPWRARLHFVEQAMFYLLSIPLLILMVTPVFGLFFDRFPLDTDPTTYAVHFWGFALAIELMLLALAADQPRGSLWRSRLSWIGMAPVYATSVVRALWYGPHRKPTYRVTRKTDSHQVYVRIVTVHWLLLAAAVIAILVAVLRDDFLLDLDLGSAYWAVVGLVGLGSFIRLSWFGVDVRRRAVERLGVLDRRAGPRQGVATGSTGEV